MKNRLILVIGIVVLGGIRLYYSKDNSKLWSKAFTTVKAQNESKSYQQWSISELSKSLANSKENQINFMDKNSMKGTYLEIDKGKSHKSTALTDEVYYLYSGTCKVQLSKKEQDFNKGDVLFVKKGSELNIENTKELLQIVKVSMVLDSNNKAPHWKHFSESDIVASRSSSQNEWSPFIRYSNVIFGMYMLPHPLDGDGRLVHPWQELNIITAGSSKFVMDTDTIDVKEGSIVFVEEGNGHYFEKLNNDIDILILWEQRNVDHERH